MVFLMSSFFKSPFSKRVPSTLKRKVGVFKFFPFEECFEKLPAFP